jgi:CheY-like chemotaxis protein
MCELIMIDDNPMEHLIMQKMFDRYDLFKDAAYFYDGRPVIDLLKESVQKHKHVPNIILLDLNMPQFSGWQFLEAFEALYPSLNKNIPVYITSLSVSPADKLRARLYPFVKDFYQKPIKKDDMILLYLTYKAIHRIAG